MELKSQSESETIRLNALDKAFHSYGYNYIFTERSKLLNKKLKFLNFLGIIVPLIIGCVVTTYGTEFLYLKNLIYIAGVLGIVQLFMSAWALCYEWNNAYGFYLEASIEFMKLHDSYFELSTNPPKSTSKLKLEMEKLNAINENINKQCSKYPFSQKENRKGMRYSLRKFQRECAGCNKIPKDMKNSNCGVCGNFKILNK